MAARKTTFWLTMMTALMAAGTPAAAQVRSVDPDAAIDGDLSGSRGETVRAAPSRPLAPVTPAPLEPAPMTTADPTYAEPLGQPAAPAASADTFSAATVAAQHDSTFHKDDLIGAAEGVFGKGARGLAEMIEDVLKKQGEPDGYIVGREGGGALVIGLRYGSGTLYHKVEGQQPVYWTGPSIGFDAGLNAGNAFVLVYNLYNTADLYKRFGAGEGQAYLVGGFNVSYLRRGNIVLVPVRMGAGLRLGINAGYMKFSHRQNWLPF
jgi:hypothetical protein